MVNRLSDNSEFCDLRWPSFWWTIPFFSWECWDTWFTTRSKKRLGKERADSSLISFIGWHHSPLGLLERPSRSGWFVFFFPELSSKQHHTIFLSNHGSNFYSFSPFQVCFLCRWLIFIGEFYKFTGFCFLFQTKKDLINRNTRMQIAHPADLVLIPFMEFWRNVITPSVSGPELDFPYEKSNLLWLLIYLCVLAKRRLYLWQLFWKVWLWD